ncbi:MAG: hypothetical protein ACR2H2_13230 [Solirubrobacteraceae bacterium]
MGQAVVHFEVIGKDGGKLQSYYSELFGWEMDTNNPMNYGLVAREGNVSPDGIGIVRIQGVWTCEQAFRGRARSYGAWRGRTSLAS